MAETNTPNKTLIDFFAGIGLVRYALERRGWTEIFALDYSRQKSAMYGHHFGNTAYHIEDVHAVDPHQVPFATLAHASFPCTDTSVAGGREGLAGSGSSAVWGFIRVLRQLPERPPLVLLENVEGFLTSNKQQDIIDVLKALNTLGYSVDVMLVDAAHFVPQSRVRLFVVGVRDADAQTILEQDAILNQRTQARPDKIATFIRVNPHIDWYLSALPSLPKRTTTLDDVLDLDEHWWSEERSAYLFDQMHDHHKVKVVSLMTQETWSYATAFRRMRVRNGVKQSTAELRFDGIAGCLRTPKGGSARQIVVRVGFGRFDARLLNARENARLMGADEYTLSPRLSLNDALFGFGDAVCVPVVEWISEHSLEPLYIRFVEQQSLVL